jgi:NDP-hexose-3-ketoreductase
VVTTPMTATTQPADAPVRIGVLGCAGIAWRNTLPAMLRVSEVELVAMASRDLAKAERFATRFGGVAVRGYAELLERPDIDAVYVALPNGLHREWAGRAMDAGKHVFVEKPFAVGLTETRELVAIARHRRLWLMENFMFLYHSQHAAVRNLIASGKIGEPRLFTSAFGIPALHPNDIRYRADLGGGALLDVGVYPVRAAQLMLCDEFTVTAAVLRKDRARDVDLGGCALLCSGDDVPAELSFSFETSYRSMYAVWGSEGRVSLERAFTPPAGFRPTLRVERQDHVEDISLPPDDQFANIVRAFAGSVRDGADGERYWESLIRHAALVEEIRNRAHEVAAR